MNGHPPVRGVLETAIYSDDLARAHSFYGGFLGLECVLDTPRMLTYAVAPAQVLLVFKRGATREDIETPEGLIPGHHSEGPAHFAFAIAAGDYAAWKAHLQEAGSRPSQRDDLGKGRKEPLLRRSGWKCRGTRHARTVAELLIFPLYLGISRSLPLRRPERVFVVCTSRLDCRHPCSSITATDRIVLLRSERHQSEVPAEELIIFAPDRARGHR